MSEIPQYYIKVRNYATNQPPTTWRRGDADYWKPSENNTSNLTYMYGNVGIGIPNPLQKLHIEGNTYISSNVGIGTTNPLSKLHINGSITQFANFPCFFIRNIYEEYDSSARSFTNTWADGKVWTSRTYNANSKLILYVYIPCRNDSSSWGGGYHGVQYNINNTGWIAMGDCGYSSVMTVAGADIGTYTNILYMPLTINTSFTCQFKYVHKSFDGTLTLNTINDVGTGTTNSYGINVNQYFTKLLIIEIGG